MKRVEQALVDSGIHSDDVPEWLESSAEALVKELYAQRIRMYISG